MMLCLFSWVQETYKNFKRLMKKRKTYETKQVEKNLLSGSFFLKKIAPSSYFLFMGKHVGSVVYC
jgi:hypothetical protein